MIVGRMVTDPVEPYLHPVGMDIADEGLEVLGCAVAGVYFGVILYTVGGAFGVFDSHFIKWQQVNDVDSEILQSREIFP